MHCNKGTLHMKFQPDTLSRVFINGTGSGWVMVNGQKYSTSILVNSESGVHPWPSADDATLDEGAFEPVTQLDTEIALFGSGSALVFPAARLLRGLIQKGIGLETMDTPAACRTFNILAGEGRKVTAALRIGSVS
jgi:uncharacterized protein